MFLASFLTIARKTVCVSRGETEFFDFLNMCTGRNCFAFSTRYTMYYYYRNCVICVRFSYYIIETFIISHKITTFKKNFTQIIN